MERSFFRFLTGMGFLGLLALPLFSCRALFWSDTKSALQVRWKDARVAYEPVLYFESKVSLLPWHGNAQTRDYSTEILRHELSGEHWKTRALGKLEGWVLEASLFSVGRRLVLVRGKNDNLGTLPGREVVLLPDAKFRQEEVLVLNRKNPDRFVLLAIPSPDGRRLVVFSTASTVENPGSDLYAEFYRIDGKSPAFVSEVALAWDGVPGMPLAAWGRDGGRVYLHRGPDVLSITESGFQKARTFPKCFVATRFSGELSPSGKRLFRDPELGWKDGLPKLRLGSEAPVLGFGKGPMIRDASQVSPYCEK